MPVTSTWPDIGLRIVLTVLAAMAIGFERRARTARGNAHHRCWSRWRRAYR